MAASIAGGTIGLALSHAFEAAFIAQTVIRPITSALQTGFNKVAQIGNGGRDTNGDATGWMRAMDFGRQTQSQATSVPQRATGAGAHGCSRHIDHAVELAEYDADESRHRALWKHQWHNDYGQSDQQDLKSSSGRKCMVNIEHHHPNRRQPLSPEAPVPMTELIEQQIFLLRGHRVMLSTNLARLYEVEPRALVQAVKRNIARFPEDFMFQTDGRNCTL